VARIVSEPRESILEELIREEPRLLRAEVAPAEPGGSAAGYRGILLTFDVARLVVAIDAEKSTLRVTAGSEVELDEVDIEAVDEEEPWWTLMGHELARARRGPDVLELQFRADDQSPKLLTLALRDGAIHVGARKKGGG
jgi:hypothetical protein